ncbi:DUF559 domain-containing protein [Carboxydothermus pertinax]|uniref:DUF559 domain-containing protein n=1 Tax=Carboxydothermus pertinax TaxID=870242 RepID=A0A1L8CRN6_9THEO|nr:DUF559 domain-containing protein [Carboxydothermus pertinax]GAV21595.1 hypothetical protein cpu_01050 [Carboxydothermus pertinax]
MNFFKCWGCGTVVPMATDKPLARVFCPDCKEEYPKQLEAKRLEYLRLRAELMFDRALRMLEKQMAKMYLYQEAAEVVFDKIKEDPEAFDSAHEMVALMELLKNRVKVKLHPVVGKYKPDMLLPNEKVVLEIDGYMHEFKKLEDYKRDIEMRAILGADWEVVRIPTKYIEQNVSALLTAIKEIKSYKQKIRAQNNGVIPKWFSKRDAEVWREVEKAFGLQS